jgi:intracellular sulfur oxidation DsrE/DsrF family protein
MAACKVLIHVSDRDKWSSALGQAKAFSEANSSSGLELIILADIFAGAVCIACDRRLREQMEEFVQAGHKIMACEHSLRTLNFRPESLPGFIGTIHDAFSEIVQRQMEGFHYIKV